MLTTNITLMPTLAHTDFEQPFIDRLRVGMLLTGRHGVQPPPKGEGDRLLETLRLNGSTNPAPPWGLWPDHLRHHLIDLAFFATLEGMSLRAVRPNLWLLSAADLEGSCLVTTACCEVLGPGDAWERFCEVYRKWLDLGAPARNRHRIEVWPPTANKRVPRDGWLLRRPLSQMVMRLKS